MGGSSRRFYTQNLHSLTRRNKLRRQLLKAIEDHIPSLNDTKNIIYDAEKDASKLIDVVVSDAGDSVHHLVGNFVSPSDAHPPPHAPSTTPIETVHTGEQPPTVPTSSSPSSILPESTSSPESSSQPVQHNDNSSDKSSGSHETGSVPTSIPPVASGKGGISDTTTNAQSSAALTNIASPVSGQGTKGPSGAGSGPGTNLAIAAAAFDPAATDHPRTWTETELLITTDAQGASHTSTSLRTRTGTISTSLPIPTITENVVSHSGPLKGLIAGIVVTVLVFLALLYIILVHIMRRRRKNTTRKAALFIYPHSASSSTGVYLDTGGNTAKSSLNVPDTFLSASRRSSADLNIAINRWSGSTHSSSEGSNESKATTFHTSMSTIPDVQRTSFSSLFAGLSHGSSLNINLKDPSTPNSYEGLLLRTEEARETA